MLSFMLESKNGVKIYNPQRVTRQFAYDQGAVVLTGEQSASSASVGRQGYRSRRESNFGG